MDNLSAAIGGPTIATREAQRARQEQHLRPVEQHRDSMEVILMRMNIDGPPGENERRMRYGQDE